MPSIVSNSSNENVTALHQLQDAISQHSSGKNKLTNWKNEPTAEMLLGDYKNALPAHKYYTSRINEWLNLLNEQTDKSKLKKGRSGLAPKVIRRLAEWRYANLTATLLNERNLFKVKATAPNYLSAAIQNELVLNFQFNSLIDKVEFINEFIRTLVSEGTAVVRTGWFEQTQTKEYEEEVIEYVEPDEVEYQLLTQAMAEIAQEQQQTGIEDSSETAIFQSLPPDLQESIIASTEMQKPVVARFTGEIQTVKEEVQIANRPELEVVDSNNFIIDPTCKGNFDKAKFCIYIYETNLSNLKSAGIYKNLDKIFGSTENIPNTAEEIANMPEDVFQEFAEGKFNPNNFKFTDKPRQKLVAYEYWGYYDIDGTGIVQSIVATIVNNVVIRMERNPFPDNKFPFVIVPYLPVKKSVYGEPDAELIADNQQVIKALMRSVIDTNSRSANGQTAMPIGFLDAHNLKKFNQGEDYQYAFNGMHPSEAIYMHGANEIPQSVMALIQYQFAEAEATTAVKAFQNGLDGNAYGQSVAGMSQAITAITQREADIVFRINNGLKKIGNKIVSMNQNWLNEEEVIAITDSEFQTITKDDLAGDFFLDVNIKSNSESEGKAQQLTFLMQTLGNNIPWEVTQMFLVEISRLYNLDTITGMLQKYQPQPNEQEMEMHQLEVQEKQAEIAKTEAEREYYQARSQFIEAQISNTQSDTDLKNLDFLEQQEGVKHARQKELMEAQAKAQNEGKLAHEMLKANKDLAKTFADNDSKERIANSKNKTDLAKDWNKAKSNNSNTPSRPSMRGIPNPEIDAVPDGLYTADALGNYISGDADTSVQNQI